MALPARVDLPAAHLADRPAENGAGLSPVGPVRGCLLQLRGNFARVPGGGVGEQEPGSRHPGRQIEPVGRLRDRREPFPGRRMPVGHGEQVEARRPHQLRRRAPQRRRHPGRRHRGRLPVLVRSGVGIRPRSVLAGGAEQADHVRVAGWWRPVVLRLRAEHAVLGMRDLRAGPVGSRILAVPVAARMEIRILGSLPPAAAFEPELVTARAVEQQKAERLLHRVRLAPLVGAQRVDLLRRQPVYPLPAVPVYQPDLHHRPPVTSSCSCSRGAPGGSPLTAPAAPPRVPIPARRPPNSAPPRRRPPGPGPRACSRPRRGCRAAPLSARRARRRSATASPGCRDRGAPTSSPIL